MLGSSEVIAFAATTDLDRARAFYEQVLGLPVTERTDVACVFDANGTMLRVTAVPEVATPGYTILGWRVTAAPGGALVAWFADPDGNTLSLTQFPRHA
ncbi:VOC family protein [Trebonia sp.]|uniref:VOC family protein n=1 Tax=Trebonia sp. TaxID=2767075 RepID=UPI002604624B|nr:VOC family protein [Trebonia sp.]